MVETLAEAESQLHANRNRDILRTFYEWTRLECVMKITRPLGYSIAAVPASHKSKSTGKGTLSSHSAEHAIPARALLALRNGSMLARIPTCGASAHGAPKIGLARRSEWRLRRFRFVAVPPHTQTHTHTQPLESRHTHTAGGVEYTRKSLP